MNPFRHSMCRSGVVAAVALAAATSAVVVGIDGTLAGAVPPTPLFVLDATNPASYPGSGSTWTDLSGNGRHGTIHGAVTFDSATHSMQFPGGSNGTAWVSLSGAFDDFSNGLTLQFEAEFGATRAPWERVFDFAAAVGDTDYSMWVGQYATTNELALEIWNNGTSEGYCVTSTSGTALGQLNARDYAKWVLTLGDDQGTNTCRIYKDGVELATEITAPGTPDGPNPNGSPYPLPPVVARNSALVGRSNFIADNDLEGSMRYIRLYGAVLSPSEVADASTATITFDGNGGTGTMAGQSSTSAANLTANAFSRAGYTFGGWNTAADGTGASYADQAQHPFTADGTLYAQWDAVPGASFVPLDPVRLYDSRQHGSLVGGADARELTVTGVAGVPADATAVVLNVTSTASTAGGYLTIYPCGQVRPATSNVNFEAGQDTANQATVKVGDSGKICVFAPVGTDVVIDVNGAYSPNTGTGRLTPMTPVRMFDSRTSGAKVQPAAVQELTVAGAYGVPADATAVLLNVTVTEPDAAGYVTAFPCGGTQPWVSSVNFRPGQTVPNLVAVKVGTAGKVCFAATTATHLVVDAVGAMSSTGTGWYGPLVPARLLDSRTGSRLEAGTFELTVAGQGGVDAQASAVVLNVTVTNPQAMGYVTVYPCGTAAPFASNVNFSAGQTVANAAVVGLGSGKVCVYTTTPIDLVVDVFGHFITQV